MTAGHSIADLLAWCASTLGAVEETLDRSKSHPGEPAVTYRLRTGRGYCYLKTHRDPCCWEAEVHAYEQWTSAFGDRAPRLLAVREEEPRALVMSEIAGTSLADIRLPVRRERAVWRVAGQALARLHDAAVGDFFGPCRRDGRPAETPIRDPVAYISTRLEKEVARGVRKGYLRDRELSVVQAARHLMPAFEGERPVPCHRDYGPANWLVTTDGAWAGVVDFEFAQWDVRAVDFARYPDWDWLSRPDLADAFFDGYGRSFTTREKRQRLIAHVQYAVTAIVWGSEHAYHGFAEDGRKALRHLATLLP